jgi:hypothetical protein
MAGIVRQIGLASPAPGFAVLVLQIAIGAAIYGALNLIFRRGDVVQLAGLIRARA